MNTMLKRVISLMLCFVLATSCLPVGAFATETGETVATEATEVTTEPTPAASEETEAPSESTEAPTDPSEDSSESTDATIVPTEPEVIAVTGITLDVTTLEVGVGAEPVTLTATVTPEDATDKTVTWTSSEPGVASVADGVVTFGYMGEAVITAKAGEFTATCDVTVGEGEATRYDYTGPAYLDAAIFCSDVHGSNSDLTSVLGGVKTSGVDYSSIGLVGDTCLTVANTTSTVQSALGDTDIEVMFSYAASHDTENSADISTNWDYSGEVENVSDYYLVYTIRETDMQNSSGASTAAPAFTTWYNGLTAAQKKLPIFIMSHRPLHDRRDDNAGAATWYDAISAAAETSDIVFFWAHNHTSESNVDTAAYYVAKDGDETFTVYNGDTVTPNFTYMNAGYINANNQKPDRIGVATTVRITADSMIFQDYNSSGEYSGSSAHNVTVDREFAVEEVTLSSIAISGTTEYTVGDKLDLTVTATYSDGTTADVTSNATLTGYDMSTAGTQTVTATYEGKTATAEITVVEQPYVTKIAVTTLPTKTTYDVGEELDTTGMVVTATYSDGSTAEVTGYYPYGSVDMTTVGTKDVTIAYSDNGTVFKTTFTITVEEQIAADATLTKIEITQDPARTEYQLNDALDISDMVVVATFSDGTTKTLEYDALNGGDELDGYVLDGFQMHVAKQQTVTVSYTYGENTCTDTFVINVWNYAFTDTTGVSVTVADDDYGVTAVNVADSANTYVATAIADVISGDYVAYDITLTMDTKVDSEESYYTLTDGAKTVTLPIPTGVTNPAVWYVSDDGTTVTNMNATNNGDGTVTFTTTHFSTYVVGEDGTTIETGSGNATVEGSSTTTTKEVWVKVDAPTNGGEYLIVSTGTAGTSGYVMGNSTAVTPVSGTLTVNGTDGTYTYIETTGTVWTASGSGSSWSFANGSNYLGYTQSSSGNQYFGGLTYSYELNTEASSTTWTLNNSQLYIYLQESTAGSIYGGSDSSANHYLTGGSSWSMETDSANVYFYQKVTASETTGTVGHIYSTVGTDITDAVALSGQTVTLSSILYDTPDGGTTTDITATSGLTPTYEVVTTKGNPNVITSISGSTATLSGVAGTAVVKVTYTSGDLVAWDEFIVTAVAPVCDLAITTSVSQLKAGAASTFVATATMNDTAIAGATITWSSSDADIAHVHETSGVVTGMAVGNATITATWTDPNGTVHTDSVEVEVLDAVYSLDLCEPTYTEVASDAEFDSSVTYFIKQDDGTYIAATGITEFADGVTYYTQSTTSITAPIVVKNVNPGDAYQDIWAVIYADGEDIGKLTDDQLTSLTYISNNTNIATVDETTGHITFQGGTGTVTITCMYEYADGKYVTDSVIISVSDDADYVPEDGTNDFPEYPNEGAIRFDKTATAVGNFSKTGIVNVELSMTGVPYTTGSEIDVVVMLDMTGSMSDNGMTAAEEATVAFVEKIVKNEDGSYNNNRVAVYAFNSGDSSPYELVALDSISSDTELETANTAIRTASDKQASGGTPFDEATKKCYDVLQAAKTDGIGNDRQQFCVFMSDGGPTTYYGSDEKTYYGGNNNSGDVLLTEVMTGYNSSTASGWVFSVPTEYYTDLLKADGVTVYTVGLLLQTAPSNPEPYSSMTDSTYDSTTDSLTTIGSHYFFTSNILKQMASSEDKYIDIFNVDNASKATAAFESIAKSILDAAKDVKVTDKMAENFTMVFDAPNATVEGELPEGQEFYIEVKDYTLNPVYGSDGTTIVDYTRGSYTSLMKVYLGTKDDDSYYAASDANGTDHATPTFNETALGTMYYWTTIEADGDSSISVVGADGTTYYFISTGKGTHNMASGAYASGTKDDTGTSQNLIIATPYFVYNADSKILVWTAEKLSSSELALSYFLYLDNSAGYTGTDAEAEAGTYDTNEYAYLNYTNFNDNPCEQEFPVPKITWNGAQVSYVFYLVNDEGQPVNRAGRVVPFSEAVYVTDVFTYAVVWNDLEQTASLEAEYLAEDLVPEVYKLYDEDATYNIHVFEDEAAQNLNNHFIIGGSTNTTNTTYVFNTKADATKYTEPATYAATSDYLCKDYNVTVNADNSVTYNGNAEQYTENGTAVYGADDKGAYTIVYNTGATVVETGFDFSNTTVAFAVTWTPELVADTVVIDYGLDVVIDVTTNDALASGVVGVRADAPSGVTMNSGTYEAAKALTADVKIGETKVATASVESLTSVRVSLDKTNSMLLSDPFTFYYESDVNYYKDGTNLTTTSMYSSVTVIPATTIYYEDEFLTLTNFDGTNGYLKLEEGKTAAPGTWYLEGTAKADATQAVDRPGESKVSEAYDADNVYGYDSAYDSCSLYSLDSAVKVTVNSDTYASASFDFYGTGFDIIGLTSNTTGVLRITVTDASGNTVDTAAVDTYYGYAYGPHEEDGETVTGWYVVASDADNALYQIPVMQINGLTYGKYSVTLRAAYYKMLDRNDSAAGYDLYLDAVRIYDPTGTTQDAYVKDNEGWPAYQELRNNVIAASDFTEGVINGIVFIDGMPQTAELADYISYGPNNELYLASGQAVVFALDLDEYEVASVQLGMKSADGNAVSYVMADGQTINSKEALTDAAATTLSTSTDMYYDITSMKDNVIVIYNAGQSGILSLTNIKVTFTKETTVDKLFYVDYDVVQAVIDGMNAEDTEGEGNTESSEETEAPATTVAPFTPTVEISAPENVTAGNSIKVTVTTSSDVAALTVNDEWVTTYTKSGDRLVWTTDIATETAGTVNVEVVCYNAESTASKAVTKAVTVSEATEGTVVVDKTVIKNLVATIMQKLRNWFSWS